MKGLIREINSIPGLDQNLIDVKIVQHAIKEPDNADSLVAGSLVMRCWCTGFGTLTPVPPRLRALILLR